MRCKPSFVRTILPYFLSWCTWTLHLLPIFCPFLTCWITFDRVFLTLFTLVPPAATWSRSRHSDIPGQRPLFSRLAPLGLPSLTPSENDKVNSANRALEAVLWCAEQALCCKTKAVGLNIICPEDLGGHQSEGPSSLWVLREFQLLEGIRDARRAAGYLCQFTRIDFKRPLGVFSTSRKLRARLSLGWPHLERIRDKLVYKGPEELCLQPYPYPYDWYFLRRCFLFFKFSFFHFRLLETFCCRPPSGRGAQSP